jgi:hypothetical protein
VDAERQAVLPGQAERHVEDVGLAAVQAIAQGLKPGTPYLYCLRAGSGVRPQGARPTTDIRTTYRCSARCALHRLS